MAAIEEGRKCTIRNGRRINEEVEIVKLLENNLVLVSDQKGKERKISIKHLKPNA